MQNFKKSEITDDGLNTLSMNIIVHAGNSREFLVKALESLENNDFDKANRLLKKAHDEIITAHGLQTDTLQAEANGHPIRYSTLFCHAQDTLMTAQSELLITDHLVGIFRGLKGDSK